MNKIIEKDLEYIAHTYNRFPIEVTRGQGVYVFDENDKAYLDFTTGIGVNGLGYNYQPWVDATTKQLSTLQHISNLFHSKPNIDLAETLCKKTNCKKVFFANSGAESNEGAIKIARKYANDKYHGTRNEILTLENSFHGRTLSTLSATGQDSFHDHFGPFVEGFNYIAPNNIADLHKKVSDTTLAIMIEIVQGEGGVVPLEASFLKEIQMICKERDILFIIDEVQTGIGRCGKLFAYMHYNLHPDLVTCAKGLGNGLPIGAILIGEKCEHVFHFGDHGTTYGGNPVASAGANVVLDAMDNSLLHQVQESSEHIKHRLLNMPFVKSVEGLGLMLGVSFEDNVQARDIVLACIQQGVLFLTAKDKLRMLPPLIITKTDIDKAMDVLEGVLTKIGE